MLIHQVSLTSVSEELVKGFDGKQLIGGPPPFERVWPSTWTTVLKQVFKQRQLSMIFD